MTLAGATPEDVFFTAASFSRAAITAAENAFSEHPRISADGSRVVFRSQSSNLVPGVTGMTGLTAVAYLASFEPVVTLNCAKE